MVIHSVMPYPFLMEQPEQPPSTVMEIQGGYLEGYHSPKGFVASRLITTDPALYLKAEYAPGSIIHPKGNQ
ncbi:MAG TPA: hypothetical protein GX499_00305 [Clostridiales bacterium]|nr:hypothetical protein [Clostridiales bacterium]